MAKMKMKVDEFCSNELVTKLDCFPKSSEIVLMESAVFIGCKSWKMSRSRGKVFANAIVILSKSSARTSPIP